MWHFYRPFVLFLVLVCISCDNAFAVSLPTKDNSMNIELIGHAGGACTDLAVEGDIVFASVGEEVVAVDYSDPMHPRRRGSLYIGKYITDIIVNDGVLYVAAGDASPLIIDAHNPDTLTPMGYYQHTSYISNIKRTLAYWGGMVLVCLQGGYILVVDVSNPSQPELLSQYVESEPTGYGFEGIDIDNGVVYTGGGTKLCFLSLSDLGVLSPLCDIFTLNKMVIRDISAHDGLVHIVGDYSYNTHWCIVDASDMAAPHQITFADRFDTEADAIVAADDNIVYITEHDYGEQGLKIFDVGTPSAPVELGRHTTEAAKPYDLAVQGNRVYYAAGEGGIEAVDISNHSAPQELGQSWWPSKFSVRGGYGILGAMDVFGDIVWVAHSISTEYPHILTGLRRNPDNSFSQLGSLDIGATCVGLDAINDLLFVAADKLYIVDTSDPSHLLVLSSVEAPLPPQKVLYWGGYAYVELPYGGLMAVDVTNPSAPGTPQSSVRTNSSTTMHATRLVAQNGRIYAGYMRAWQVNEGDWIDYYHSSHVLEYDISDPAFPKYIGANSIDMYYDFGIWGGVGVSVSLYSDTSHSLDCRTWLSLTSATEHNDRVVGYPNLWTVEVLADYAFYSADQGIQIYDVRHGVFNERVGYYEKSLTFGLIKPRGDLIYVASDTKGITLFRFTGEWPKEDLAGQNIDPSLVYHWDTDGDGIPDYIEGAKDLDGDGVANYQDDNSDGDGKSDAEEAAMGFDPYRPNDSFELSSGGWVVITVTLAVVLFVFAKKRRAAVK